MKNRMGNANMMHNSIPKKHVLNVRTAVVGLSVIDTITLTSLIGQHSS